MIHAKPLKDPTQAPSVCYEEEQGLSDETIREMRTVQNFFYNFGTAALMAYGENQGLVTKLGEEHV